MIFANNQINAPAGIATLIARPSTNNVRSNIERTITFANCGLRYGGNSNVKADGTPFNNVILKRLDTQKVRIIPNRIVPVSNSADTIPLQGAASIPAKNIVIIAIRVG